MQQVNSGAVKAYFTDTAATLQKKTGICIDLSALFAAMCRSENIPCAISRGFCNGAYHAWNKVFIDDKWYQVDLTYACSYGQSAFSAEDMKSPLSYERCEDDIAVS